MPVRPKQESLKQQQPYRPAMAMEAYLPLVHSIAAMISGKGLPPNIDYNDLVSDGTIGLMKAWDNFDPKRGVKFETYASYRVRGEILDGLKYYNPVPYRIQVMIRDLAKKGYDTILKRGEKESGISTKDSKLLEKKSLSESEFKAAVTKIQKIVSASALMYLVSLEQASDSSEIQVSGERTPVEELESSDLKLRLDNEIKSLPKMERTVLELFFKKGLSQKDIAKDHKLSRSKVNRLIARAINRLKEKLK
ncbi:MAG: sigma-70 family RNA polymerase sigma factor [Candidatus Saganbacteria bacterium]|nr:sigma-70 family RNA polymerase sigma factor [Candidatus Saganbacteria bacterium]